MKIRVIGLTSKTSWHARRALIASQLSSPVSSIQHASIYKRVAFWSAAALAFLVAPLSALVWTGSSASSTGLNLVSSSSSAADAQGQNNVNNHQGSVSTESITSSNDSGAKAGDSSASVNVDGQDFEVPDEGMLNKTVTTSDGQTTHVTVTNSTSSSTSGGTQNTNSHLRVRSHSTTNVYTDSSP